MFVRNPVLKIHLSKQRREGSRFVFSLRDGHLTVKALGGGHRFGSDLVPIIVLPFYQLVGPKNSMGMDLNGETSQAMDWSNWACPPK